MVQVTVWFGKGSTGDEREMAKALAITKNPEPELMFEGQEKGSFWSDLGGAPLKMLIRTMMVGCREGGLLHRLGFPPGGRSC